MSPNKGHRKEWFAIGLDKHSSTGEEGNPPFFASNNPQRFPGSESIQDAKRRFADTRFTDEIQLNNLAMMESLGLPIPHMEELKRKLLQKSQRKTNDLSNVEIMKVFAVQGIDMVFASSFDKLKTFFHDQLCRVVAFHCSGEDLGNTTQLLRSRSDIIQILLYNEARYAGTGIDFRSDDFFEEVGNATNVFVPVSVPSEVSGDRFIAAVKPFLVTTLLDVIFRRLERMSV